MYAYVFLNKLLSINVISKSGNILEYRSGVANKCKINIVRNIVYYSRISVHVPKTKL